MTDEIKALVPVYKGKKILTIATSVIILISACTSTSSTEEVSDSTRVDSSEISIDTDSSSLPPVSIYPLNDSIWSKASCRTLKVKEVKSLFYPVNEYNESDLTVYVKRYFELDSIKRGLTDKDIGDGQIVSVKVKFMDTLYANMNYTLCSWLLEYNTAEQCPYASGTLAAVSAFDSNARLISSALVAENSGGADAPISWEQISSARIQSDGRIYIKHREAHSDDDKNEIILSEQLGEISSDGVILLKGKKQLSKKNKKIEN